MEIVVVDGQGGGIGRSIIQALKKNFDHVEVIGVGTNSIATTSLKKGGADIIATGEHAIVYNVIRAQIVIGPIGIAFANSMYGEITPQIAQAVSETEAIKYLIPMSQSQAHVVGVSEKTVPEYIEDLIQMLK